MFTTLRPPHNSPRANYFTFPKEIFHRAKHDFTLARDYRDKISLVCPRANNLSGILRRRSSRVRKDAHR